MVSNLSLSFESRKKIIMSLLDKTEKVRVDELAEELQVSGETIRRDLDKLEREGLLKKVFGGAIKEKSESRDIPFNNSSEVHKEEKLSICRAAAEIVEDGDSIMLGYGTTVFEIVHFLSEKKNLTIITNSIPVLYFAAEKLDARIIFAGGEIDCNQKASNDSISERMLETFKVNKVFISVSALSMIDGLTDYDLHGANISRKMIERGENVIVLADYSKFGKVAFTKICPLENVSMIITDSKCPEDWVTYLQKKEVELKIAEDS